jgi:hypothetical protein
MQKTFKGNYEFPSSVNSTAPGRRKSFIVMSRGAKNLFHQSSSHPQGLSYELNCCS